MCIPEFPTRGAAWRLDLIAKCLETHGVVATDKDSLMTIMSPAAFRCKLRVTLDTLGADVYEQFAKPHDAEAQANLLTRAYNWQKVLERLSLIYVPPDFHGFSHSATMAILVFITLVAQVPRVQQWPSGLPPYGGFAHLVDHRYVQVVGPSRQHLCQNRCSLLSLTGNFEKHTQFDGTPRPVEFVMGLAPHVHEF